MSVTNRQQQTKAFYNDFKSLDTVNINWYRQFREKFDLSHQLIPNPFSEAFEGWFYRMDMCVFCFQLFSIKTKNLLGTPRMKSIYVRIIIAFHNLNIGY